MRSKIQNPKSVLSGAEVSKIQNLLVSLGLFLLALLPRAYDLSRFVTADEAKWVYRSAQFLAAMLQGDYAATSVNLTPAVTTTWLGSLGLALYYRLHQATIDLPFTDWLLSLPEFRTELDILVATRWPMAVMTSFAVVAIYWLARRLFNPAIALIAAAFIALDPHTVALSRILGHDAPTAVFMILSLLLLLLADDQAGEQGSRGAEEISAPRPRSFAPLLYVLSGIAAGLAFLSKAPALFLVPFAGLLFVSKVWGNSASFYFWFKRFLLWIIAAYLTFIIVWPAAWVDPLGKPLAVVENAYLSATDQEEADDEGYWLVPNLGPFYYLVNGGFKLSPLVMIGAGLAIVLLVRQQRIRKTANRAGRLQSPSPPRSPASLLPCSPALLWLLTFVVLFTIFMTFGDKRSPRYILPAFPALSLVAAFGWLKLYQVASSRYRAPDDQAEEQSTSRHHGPANVTRHASRITYHFALILAAAIILLPSAPYYLTYFNPLLGGAYTAPRLVKVGWGEGLDQVGRFLQRELPDSRVGTAYASTIAPFFAGDLSGVDGRTLDYLVLYSKQVQSGVPSPTFIRFFEQFSPIFSVELDGVHYADVYPGPAVQRALTLTPGLDAAILPKPIGFRPLTPYGHIGETLEVDVVWLADEILPANPSIVTLEPLSALDFSHEGHDHGDFTDAADVTEQDDPSAPAVIFAQGEGRLTRLANDLVVSRHRLLLPADLSRGLYALRVDGRPLGEIELRNFQVPSNLAPVSNIIFDNQVALRAYQFNPTEDYIEVTLAWQAKASPLPDYTVFVQFLDIETNERLAGVDTQPLKGSWPISRWVKDEVVVDRYFVAVPPDLGPGFFKTIVGLYRPETGQRLFLDAGRDHWVVPWTLVWE